MTFADALEIVVRGFVDVGIVIVTGDSEKGIVWGVAHGFDPFLWLGFRGNYLIKLTNTLSYLKASIIDPYCHMP